MTPAIAVSLASSIAARMAAVDALALLAAMVVTVPVVGLLVTSLLLDPSAPRPYRLVNASRPTVPRLSEDQDVPQAA